MKTVRVYSANPKTPDGYNTFIFRRDLGRSLNKLAWLPLVDISANQLPDGFSTTSDDVRYEREQKKAFVAHLKEQLKRQYGPVVNDDFGTFSLQRVFCQEVQRHALATRHEFMAVLSARQIAERMVHFAGAPNEEMSRKNGIEYFEYGLARVCLGCDHYLVMGVVGIRRGSAPYYDQHVVAKFKADSEASSLQGHMRFGESAFEQVYDNRFRLILQGVEMFYNSSTQTRQALERPPKFSIIIPCYKVEKYIRACLDSVLAQKCDSWEVICTDDGSPDETGRALDDYLREHFSNITEEERVIKTIGDEDRHPEAPKRVLTGVLATGARMTVIHQQNCGVSGARNTAMTLATGEWLVYLDGDDLLSPHAFEIIEKCLKKFPDADIVRCGYVDFNDGEEFGWGEQNGAVTVSDVSAIIPSDPFGSCFQRFVFRRNVVKEVAYKGVSCTEEMGYMVRTFLRAKTLVRTDDIFYGYRILNGSMSHREVSLRRYKDYFDQIRAVTKLLMTSSKEMRPVNRRILFNRWLEDRVAGIFEVYPKSDRGEAWNYWFAEMPKLWRYKNECPGWQRLVMFCCVLFPFKFIAIVFCYFPHWLKLKGLHR